MDGLSISWKEHNSYMFPQFALIPRCLDKLGEEEATAVLIAPVWRNQIWFPQLLRTLIDLPMLLPRVQNMVTNHEGLNHPLVMKEHLLLAAWPISVDITAQQKFLSELSASSGSLGDTQQNLLMQMPGDNGIAGVLNGVLIPFQPL